MHKVIPATLVLLTLATISAEEQFKLQINDYPANVSIVCTEKKYEQDLLYNVQKISLEILKDYQYSDYRNIGDSKIVYNIVLITKDKNLPRYLKINRTLIDGMSGISVTTAGDRNDSGGYSGHSDDFLFNFVKKLKPFVNPGR